MRVAAFLVLYLFSNASLATEIQYQLHAKVEAMEQSYEQADAHWVTGLLEPGVSWGRWQVSLALPWQHVTGKYHATKSNAALAAFCENVSQYPNFIHRQVLLGNIPAELVARCLRDNSAVSNTKAGAGDATLYLSYILPLTANWAIQNELQYKFSNGNDDKGLGSATRETGAEFSLLGDWKQLMTQFSAGYILVDGGEAGIDYKDYAVYALDVRWNAWQSLAVGVEGSRESAYTDFSENVDSATLYTQYDLSRLYTLRVFVGDYLDTPYFPEWEAGMSLSFDW